MALPDDKRVDLGAQLRDDLVDSDGDGATDANERQMGTDPNDEYDTPMDFSQLAGTAPAEIPHPESTREVPNKQFWEEHFDHQDNPDGSVTITQRDLYDAPEQLTDTVGNLKNRDTDGDGLSDWEEHERKTDPNNPDTDRDGRTDGKELDDGFDALWPEPPNATPDDRDGDGIKNDDEARFGGFQGIDAHAAAGKGSDGVEGRQKAFDERKTGDPVGDAALQHDLGIEPSADDVDKLVTALGDDIFGDDPIARARADMALSGFDEAKYDPKAQAEAQEEINDRVVRGIEDALASNDPVKAMGAMRQLQLNGQSDHPDMDGLNQVVLDAHRRGQEAALASDDPVEIIGVMRQSQLLGIPGEEMKFMEDHLGDVISDRSQGEFENELARRDGAPGDGMPAPGAPGVPSMPGQPGPGPSQQLPGRQQSPLQQQPGRQQSPLQQQPAQQQPAQQQPVGEPGRGASGMDASDRRIGADVGGTGSGPAGGAGRDPGSQGAQRDPGAAQPAWGAAADNLGHGGSTTTPEPDGVAAEGPRSTSQPEAGSGLGIGGVGTRPTDVPAGSTAPSPASTRSDAPVDEGGIEFGGATLTNRPGQGTTAVVHTAQGGVVKTPKLQEQEAEEAEKAPPAEDDQDDEASDDEPKDEDADTDADAGWVDPDADEGGDVSGGGRFDFLATAGSSVVDSRVTNTGRPDSPAFGPDTSVPVGEPSDPGDEAPQDEATTTPAGTFDATGAPGYGVTTVRPDLAGLGPELDPSTLGSGGTGGGGDGSGPGASYDPSGQTSGGGADLTQGAGLGSGPGGLDVNIELADQSDSLPSLDLTSANSFESAEWTPTSSVEAHDPMSLHVFEEQDLMVPNDYGVQDFTSPPEESGTGPDDLPPIPWDQVLE